MVKRIPVSTSTIHSAKRSRRNLKPMINLKYGQVSLVTNKFIIINFIQLSFSYVASPYLSLACGPDDSKRLTPPREGRHTGKVCV